MRIFLMRIGNRGKHFNMFHVYSFLFLIEFLLSSRAFTMIWVQIVKLVTAPHSAVNHCTPYSDWCSLLHIQLSIIAHLILIGAPCPTFSCQSLHTSFWLVLLAPHSLSVHISSFSWNVQKIWLNNRLAILQHPICSWCLPWRNLGSTHALIGWWRRISY